LELAYTPEINSIPNILTASDDVEAAKVFAFVLINSPRANLALYPTCEVSLCKLYKLFGYANVNALRRLVALTNGLKLSNRDNFSCEVCLLSNSYKQISCVQPNRATRPFERVYVDIVGPMQTTGDGKERY
jgi:hypothetical protein